MALEDHEVSKILELYGLERILEDNSLSELDVFILLEQLGYINMEMYLEDLYD